MRKGFPAVLLFAFTLAAAAPAPKPVITAKGVATAAGLNATARTAIEKNVAALNAGLEKVVALHQAYVKASPAEREKIQLDMADIHAQCKALHDAIVKQLDPEQQAAYFTYLHAQLKAAGIDMTQMQHGGMMPDSAHAAMHGG